MQSLLDEFNINLKTIEDYIHHIQSVDNLMDNMKSIKHESLLDFTNHMKTFNTHKKLFEYKAIIISLYGLLENTISKWIQKHIENVSKIVSNYQELDDKFKEHHFMLSIKLISLIIEEKHSKYQEINKENILRKLYNSLSSQKTELNSEAFIPLSGNLKHSKIIEAFKPLQINLDYKLVNEKSKIDELVSRRNDIAHGQVIDDILNISMFPEYIESLKIYVTKIYDSIYEKELEYKSVHEYEQIETVHKVINNSILLFELQNNRLKIGDSIIVKNAENTFFSKIIQEIQIEKESVNEYQAINKINIGINLGQNEPNIKSNQTFYLKKV